MINGAFIASVFDEKNKLNKVYHEAGDITTFINERSDWKCFPYFKTSLQDIRARFKSIDQVQFQLFHFAGHAFDSGLQVNAQFDPMAAIANRAMNQDYIIDPGGLAKVIKAHHDVQLVFLNGCSTKNQVNKFIEAGIPAVIYTNQPLKDQVGLAFARAFYESFFSEKGSKLQKAFNYALGVIEGMKPNIQGGLFDHGLVERANLRGGLKIKVNSNEPLYALKATDQIKLQEVSAWKSSDTSIRKTSAEKDIYPVPEKCIHLCDRHDQTSQFKIVLDTVFSSSPPDLPLFIFVHDLEDACPQQVPERFKEYDQVDYLDEKKMRTDLITWHTPGLPESRHIENKPVCLERLREIYNEFIPSEAGANEKMDSKDSAIMHHDLNIDNRKCDQLFKDLLEIYLTEFRDIIKDEFTTCRVVIFSVEYYLDKDPFGIYFEQLEKKYPGYVVNMTGLPKVDRQDIGNWIKIVFDKRPIRPRKPRLRDVYLFDEEKVHMYDARDAMSMVISNYNKKLQQGS